MDSKNQYLPGEHPDVTFILRDYVMCNLNSSVFKLVMPLLFLVVSIFLSTLVRSAPTVSFLPSFELPTNTNEPIITYALNHAMLENQDSTPLLRIYADGKVKAHYPVYMKKAGDYQTQLSKHELMELIRSLVSDGILEFDKNKVRAYTQQMDAQKRQATDEMFYVSDSSRTIIEINLKNFRASPTASVVPELNRTFTWNDLPQQARRYSGSDELVRAARGADRLEALLESASKKANRR